MTRFMKMEGESVWINLERVDALVTRPQLVAVGQAHGLGTLEELHEATGRFEVAALFQHQFAPLRSFETRAEAEAFIEELVERMAR